MGSLKRKRYFPAILVIVLAFGSVVLPAFSALPAMQPARVAAEPPDEKAVEGPTSEEACEDTAIFGGIICGLVTGTMQVINEIYGQILAYSRFSLYAPVTGDEIGRTGVSQENYAKLKSIWQVFARLASLIVVAAFLMMIIGSSVTGKL